MLESDFRLPAKDGTPLFVREWLPEGKPRAVIQVVHGMAEHSERYARLARALNQHGYAVYADDHRGHGKTAQRPEDLGHFGDHDSWNLVVDDLLALSDEIKSRHPGLPCVALGHSMGSFMLRTALLRRPLEWTAVVLSGTGHSRPIVQRFNRLTPRLERLRLGKRGKSFLIRKFSFEAFNAKFQGRTEADWLSRDEAEVDKYVADPLCGFECSVQLWYDMFGGTKQIFRDAALRKLPRDLPIYVMSGARDPVGSDLREVRRLHSALDQAGLRNVTVRVYPDARHELFNETNRDEVTRDLIGWLDQQLGERKQPWPV
jgi:alpha-beta hydrolase superfamily lysophospholipase